METAHQGFLFDQQPPPWELDDAAEICVASVVFAEGAPGVYDYKVPDRIQAQLQPGMRVRVPLGGGNRPVTGYCVAVNRQARAGTRPLKSVQAVLDELPLLSPSLLELTRWMSERYLCPWGRVLERVVPGGVRRQAGTRQQLFFHPAENLPADWEALRLTPKQAQVVRKLLAARVPLTLDQLTKAAQCSAAVVQSLRRRGLLVGRYQRVSTAESFDDISGHSEHLQLNPSQQQAVQRIVEALHDARHQTFVLYGVTGSGKTEVYMRAIEEVIAFGRQAIVLVPEISLTPQTVRRFRARFRHVAVLHSHLSDAQRHWHWQRIARGDVQVVVGARSAIFAPVPHLGLIVLDEEHDGSFKQDTAPRYHAREVAWYRAQRDRVPLVLGSATPSLESWLATQRGEYELLRMPSRVLDRPLPEVATIDLRLESQLRARHGAISRPLERAMRQTLDEGGQVILLLNRRGYSTHIQCPACGHVVVCEHCDVVLTWHRDENLAVCHHCDWHTDSPNQCPNCRFQGIRFSGVGTQRLEAEVKARFPNVRAMRVDSDSMRRMGSHEEAFAAFRDGKVQILLGTQMIAKGLDFPRVTLVGVINADIGLHLPDFRAAERTFQLVTQVAGRTGRGEMGGRVLVQTLNPDHPAIEAATRHDFERFAEWDLPNRKALGYPPFGELMRLVLRGPDTKVARGAIDEIAKRVRSELSDQDVPALRIIGPATAPVSKLRGLYRFHFFIQAASLEPVAARIGKLLREFPLPEGVEWIVDVNPYDLL